MAGKIQGADIKTEAELISAGATASSLPRDTQIYVTALGLNKTLDDAITDGDLSGSGSQQLVYDNLIFLDGSYLSTKATNATADTSVGDWLAYADSAAVTPDSSGGMTGGSPNTTITRTTSSPLNGSGSFLLTLTTGASRQGEGAAVVVNIPPAYRGKTLNFYGSFSTSGTYTTDDLRLYAYDITNSTVITPTDVTKISGTTGSFNAQFVIPSTTASIRLGIHIARSSNTGSLTLKFDDLFFGEIVTPTSTTIGSWTSYTPTYTGFGTVSGSEVWWKVVGDTLQVQGHVTTGTTTATEARISLPGSYVVGSAASTSTTLAGDLLHASAGGVGSLYIYKQSGNAYVTMGYRDGSTNGLTSLNGSSTLPSTGRTSFRFEVPI